MGAATPNHRRRSVRGGLENLIDLNRSLLADFSALDALLSNPPAEPDGGRSELRRQYASTLRRLRDSRDALCRMEVEIPGSRAAAEGER